jgi:hypothetical protein
MWQESDEARAWDAGPRPRDVFYRVRLAAYALWEVQRVGRGMLADPLRPAAWGMLFELPAFGVLEPGRIYRSGEPRLAAHFRRLEELGVRTVVSVKSAAPRPGYAAHLAAAGIAFRTFALGPNRVYDVRAMCRVLGTVVDPRRQPVLVHCDGGRHRAGMVCALVRVLQGWDVAAAVREYLDLAYPAPFPDNVEFVARCARSEPFRALARRLAAERQEVVEVARAA